MNQKRELYIWEKNHIEVCNNLNLFEGKDILEVGGTIPQDITEALKVKSWTCIDKWTGIDQGSENYKILSADITTLDMPDKSFDFVFSTNAFEHIHDLPVGLKNMLRLLRPEGHLSALFGPIWSSCKGHHLYTYDNNKLYTFNDDIIPHWGHLLYSEAEMEAFLSAKFSAQTVAAILKNIYSKDIVNKKYYEDYYAMINNLDAEVLEYRDWHTPVSPDAETLEILQSKYGDRNFSTISTKILLKV